LILNEPKPNNYTRDYLEASQRMYASLVSDMPSGKKRFKELIKMASQPVPKAVDKQRAPGSYSGTQTHPRKTAGTSAKQRGKSRP